MRKIFLLLFLPLVLLGCNDSTSSTQGPSAQTFTSQLPGQATEMTSANHRLFLMNSPVSFQGTLTGDHHKILDPLIKSHQPN